MVILCVTYVVCYIRGMQSCRFAFAVHVLAVLATESKCASSASLAATVNTNPVVIRRLLIDLQNAGLIRTSRGPQGGAILAKPPKNISLWHVHSAVESRELFGQHPNPPSPHCPVGQGIEKVLGYVQKRANRSFSRELQMMSLADVVRRLHRA
jgi:Rrf2 family protein